MGAADKEREREREKSVSCSSLPIRGVEWEAGRPLRSWGSGGKQGLELWVSGVRFASVLGRGHQVWP